MPQSLPARRCHCCLPPPALQSKCTVTRALPQVVGNAPKPPVWCCLMPPCTCSTTAHTMPIGCRPATGGGEYPKGPCQALPLLRAFLVLHTERTLNSALVQVVGNAPKPPCQAATAIERLQAPCIQCMLAQSCHRWWGMPQCRLPGTALAAAALDAQLATNSACCPQPCRRWWGIPQSLLPGYCHCYPASLALCIQCRPPTGLPEVVGNTPKPPARHCPYCCVVQAASASHNRSHIPGNITQRLQQVWGMPYPNASCCQVIACP